MNLLIELILKIFTGLFERETQQRAQARPPTRGGPMRLPRSGPHGEQDPESVLAEFFRELQGQTQPPPLPTRRGRRPPVPTRQTRTESLEEHIRKQQAHIAELEARAAALARHTGTHLGVDVTAHDGALPHGLKRLPGRTPLEQLMIAGVIMGPCKAKQPRGLRL